MLCLYSSVIFSGEMGKCADNVWQFGGHAIYAELSPGGIEYENLDLSLNLPCPGVLPWRGATNMVEAMTFP